MREMGQLALALLQSVSTFQFHKNLSLKCSQLQFSRLEKDDFNSVVNVVVAQLMNGPMSPLTRVPWLDGCKLARPGHLCLAGVGVEGYALKLHG